MTETASSIKIFFQKFKKNYQMEISRYFKIILVITVIPLLFSCKNENKKDEILLPKISGKTGEVLLIIKKEKWEGDLGTAFRDLLAHDQYGLPQPEPVFDLVNITPGNFSKMHQPHRNIIFYKTATDGGEPKITVSKNQWAYPQIVINITAPDDSTAIRLLEENGQKIVSRLNEKERSRLNNYYHSLRANSVVESIENSHHLHLTIPKGYNLDVNEIDFAWAANEPQLYSQGIFIYHYPYTDTNTFTHEYLINKRDYYLKKYVPGPGKGSYMATEDILPPKFKELEINGRYFARLRGLWKLENGAMGGPFISLTTVDEKTNRVVTVDGFVYAPGKEKRELLRQVETILYSIRFTD